MKGRLEYVSFEDASTPRDGEVMTDRWWVVHPVLGLAFYVMPRGSHRTPQCNADETIARHHLCELYPGHEVRFVPVAFVGWMRGPR